MSLFGRKSYIQPPIKLIAIKLNGGVIITHHMEDKFFKIYVHDSADLFLKELKYDCKVKKILPTEIINEYKEHRMDYVILTDKNIIIDFEFDSGPLSDDDIRRYAHYAYLLGEEYKLDVITFIISTYYKHSFIKIFSIHQTASHPLFIHSLKTIDGDEVFKKIKVKYENNKKITEEDISKLVLIPFYDSKYPIEEVLYNIITLTKDLDLSKEQQTYLKISYGELLKHFVKDEKTYNKLKEVIKMRENCVLKQMREVSDRYIDSELERRTAELIEKTKQEIIEKRKQEIIEKAKQEIEKEKQETIEKAKQEMERKTQETIEKSKIEIAKEMIKNKCTKEQVINSTKITENLYLTLLKV